MPEAGAVVRSLVRVEAAAYVLSEALAGFAGYTAAGIRANDDVGQAVRAAAQIIRQAYPVSFGHALPALYLIADQALDTAELPGRVRGALSNQGIHDWGGLAGCGVQRLLEIPNLGMGAVRLITEAAVWRAAVIAAGEMAGSSAPQDPATGEPQTLPAGCIALPLQALAAWAVAERGIAMVGELLALGPDVTGLPADIAREWERAKNLDLRWLAGGPTATPQLPGLLHDLLNEVDDRRREILTRRTFAPQPETLDALAADFGISRGRVRQLEESARVKIAIAVRGAKYAPVRWRAHTLANIGGVDSAPEAQLADPWAGPLLDWMTSRDSTDLG